MTISKKVYNNNQIFIPSEIREELDIGSGDVVDWKINEKNEVILTFRKKRSIEELAGKFSTDKPFNAVEDIKKLRNGEDIE